MVFSFPYDGKRDLILFPSRGLYSFPKSYVPRIFNESIEQNGCCRLAFPTVLNHWIFRRLLSIDSSREASWFWENHGWKLLLAYLNSSLSSFFLKLQRPSYPHPSSWQNFFFTLGNQVLLTTTGKDHHDKDVHFIPQGSFLGRKRTFWESFFHNFCFFLT